MLDQNSGSGGNTSYSFCFVCQRGVIEVMALLLVMSLRRNLFCRYELIAAWPSEYGELRPWLLLELERQGVKMIEIKNKITKSYAIGNKLSCLEEAAKIAIGDYLVFLDTDIFCNESFYGVQEMRGCGVGVRVAGKAHLGEGEEGWKKLYDQFDLELPIERVECGRTHQISLPYFNAGFLAVQKGSELPSLWLKTAQAIFNREIFFELRFLDQVSLPIAIARAGIKYCCLPEKYNSIPANSDVAIFNHYHNFLILRDRVPQCRDLLNELLDSHDRLQYEFEKYYLSYKLEMIRG